MDTGWTPALDSACGIRLDSCWTFASARNPAGGALSALCSLACQLATPGLRLRVASQKIGSDAGELARLAPPVYVRQQEGPVKSIAWKEAEKVCSGQAVTRLIGKPFSAPCFLLRRPASDPDAAPDSGWTPSIHREGHAECMILMREGESCPSSELSPSCPSDNTIMLQMSKGKVLQHIGVTAHSDALRSSSEPAAIAAKPSCGRNRVRR